MSAYHQKPRETQPLTDRETDALFYLALGMSNREIAPRMCISPHTVADHVRSVFVKLDVSNRVQAAVLATRMRLV